MTLPRRRPLSMGGSAITSTCSNAATTAATSARTDVRSGPPPTLSTYSPPGARTRAAARAASRPVRPGGVMWRAPVRSVGSGAKTSRMIRSRLAGWAVARTSAASATRMRRAGARGRPKRSRARAARPASISTAVWWEPGYAWSTQRASAQPAPPRCRARSGVGSGQCARTAAAAQRMYSKAMRSGRSGSSGEDSTPLT